MSTEATESLAASGKDGTLPLRRNGRLSDTDSHVPSQKAGMNRERRIPPFAEDALAVLNEAVGDVDDGLPKDAAKALLADDGHFG